MLRRLADAIGLREGEEARTGRLFALILTLTMAFVFAKAAQQGIFLGAYPRDRIPDAFIISALLLAGTSFLSSALAARLGPVRLLSVLLIISAVLLVAARFAVPELPGGPMILYAVVEASIGLLLVQSWAVVTEVLDLRSAKRLLPLIGNAASIGWAVGGFTTRPIAGFLGTEALLLGSAGLMVVSFVLVSWIERVDLAGRAARGRKGTGLWAGARAGVRAVADTPLLRVLALITVAGLLGEQLLDYLLFASAQIEFAGDADRIASFMGTFFGATGLIGMALQLLVAGRILSRLGSARASLAAPGAALIGGVLFVASPSFAIVVAVRGAYRVFKQSLSSPARAQIQGVLPAVQRSQAGALLKGVLAPLFYAVGGFALKLIPADTDLRYLAVGAAAISGIAVVATAIALGAAYITALRRSIDRARLDLGAVQEGALLDPEHYQILSDEVGEADPERAALAVSLLASGDPRLARPPLRRALDHPAPSVRTAAIEALGELGDPADADAIAERLAGTADEDEQRAAMTALVTIGAGDVDAALARHEADANLHIRALARAYRLASGRAEAVSPLVDMMAADDAAVREAAVWALTHVAVDHPEVERGVARLLSDPAPAVRRAAITAAGGLRAPELVGPVVRALADPDTAGAAFAAFESIDDSLMGRVEEALDGAPLVVYSRTAAALAASDGPAGERLLGTMLVHDRGVVRYRAARALAVRKRRRGKPPETRDEIMSALRREVAIGYGYYALLIGIAQTDGVEDFEIEPEFEVVATELRVRIRQTEKRIFSLLALVADARTVRTTESSLRSGNARRVARALELLEHTLDPELARTVVPFLDRQPLRMRRRELTSDLPIPRDYLTDPLKGLLSIGDQHLEHCAMLCYGETIQRDFPEIHARCHPVIPLVQRLHFLRRVPLFAGLSGEDLMQVARIASPLVMPANQIIFHKGDPGDEMYLIMRGRVSVRDGDRELASIGADEFFGELAVLDDEPRSATIVCIEETELLSIAQADLDELMERRPEIAREIIHVLTRRLRTTSSQA